MLQQDACFQGSREHVPHALMQSDHVCVFAYHVQRNVHMHVCRRTMLREKFFCFFYSSGGTFTIYKLQQAIVKFESFKNIYTVEEL